MEAYSGFAELYDSLMDDFDYPAWARYYLSLLKHAGVTPRSMCDCACGTGSLTVEFSRSVPNMIAVDLSPEMLEQAAKKSRQSGRNIRFVCQNIAQLRLPGTVDAVVCGCDGVNYLTADRDVRAFFKCAYDCINPGGALAFDISSEYKLREVMGDAFFGEERDDVAYLWQNTLSGNRITMDLTFFVKQENGLYKRFTETHRQRIHDPEVLKEMLLETGFKQVSVFGDRTMEKPGMEEMRIHILAKK